MKCIWPNTRLWSVFSHNQFWRDQLWYVYSRLGNMWLTFSIFTSHDSINFHIEIYFKRQTWMFAFCPWLRLANTSSYILENNRNKLLWSCRQCLTARMGLDWGWELLNSWSSDSCLQYLHNCTTRPTNDGKASSYSIGGDYHSIDVFLVRHAIRNFVKHRSKLLYLGLYE